jgi:hypothetical protein
VASLRCHFSTVCNAGGIADLSPRLISPTYGGNHPRMKFAIVKRSGESVDR